jgi:serine/threonine protein kinase
MAEPTANLSEPTAKPAEERDLTGATLGDYRVLRRLGQGGMGQVYLAEQVSLKRHVALKLLKPELAANQTALLRFEREAKSVARVTHANIVQIYAIGQLDGKHYMALEYVEGRTLREFIEKKGPPDANLGLRIISQVASALQRASELDVIHRDIKPENILITRKGEVKVADFGLSRVFEDEAATSPSLTGSAVTMGTPLYMSPEQVEGKKDIDHRTDIYSLGITCYHLFAGHPPFRGETPFEVAVQHVQKEAPPLSDIRPDLPIELCQIVHKMIAKKPEERYQTGREVLRDIAKVREMMLVGSSPGSQSGSIGLSFSGTNSSPMLPAVEPKPKSSAQWMAVPALVVALVGGLTLGWLWNGTAASTTNPPIGPGQAIVEPPKTDPQREHEKDLIRLVHDHIKPNTPLDIAVGVRYSIELSVHYLKDRNLAEADKLFDELDRADRPAPYRSLGKFGKAVCLAFRDQPDESNRIFVQLVETEAKFAETKTDKKLAIARNNQFVWRSNPELREVMAEALQFNFVNAPDRFPKKLEPFRSPPPPTLKGKAS